MKLKAFTLAEVIIVLGILGVIGALTIPVINARTEEAKFVAQLKKANNSLINAMKLATLDNDNLPIEHWESFAAETSLEGRQTAIKNALMANMNIANNCSDINKCIYSGTYKNIKNEEVTQQWAPSSTNCFMTSDGITYYIHNEAQNGAGTLIVDLNGPQKPNTFGIDVFAFRIVIPHNISPRNDLVTCNKSNTADAYKMGLGCTEWVLLKGNMDYRRKDVAW